MVRRLSWVPLVALPMAWTACNTILGNNDGVFVDPSGGEAGQGDGNVDGNAPPSDVVTSDRIVEDSGDATSTRDALSDAKEPPDASSCVDANFASDPANCGACGHGCGGGGCQAGQCQPITFASNMNEPFALAADGTNVYWTTLGVVGGADKYKNESVYICPASGCVGAPATLASDQKTPASMTLDSANVYWANQDDGTIVTCAISGCNQLPRVVTAQAGILPAGIAFGAGSVFWVEEINGGIFACSVGGCGTPTTLANVGASNPTAIAFLGGTVYWTNLGTGGTNGSVMSCAAAGCGGSPASLFSPTPGPSAIAVDATGVYWTTDGPSFGKGALLRVPLGGASTTTPIVANLDHPLGVALDNGYAYVADNGSGTIWRAPVSGVGTPIAIATSQSSPVSVAVDASWIYWTNRGPSGTTAGSVVRVAK